MRTAPRGAKILDSGPPPQPTESGFPQVGTRKCVADLHCSLVGGGGDTEFSTNSRGCFPL